MDGISHTPADYNLAIEGMSCASCVTRVEKTLAAVTGVEGVSVNLATGIAHVRAEPGTGLDDLIAAVTRAGYGATPGTFTNEKQSQRDLWELLAGLLLCAPLLAGMLWAMPGWVGLVLAAPVQFWLGARFYRGAVHALRAGSASMDVLVALGTSAAFGLSVVNLARGSGPLYFESAAVVITLVRLGKYLESRAKREAAKAITRLGALRPDVAHLAAGGDLPLAALRVGDVIEIRPGERVPVDGEIIDGAGSLDESPITGESLPVSRKVGDHLLAGTLSLNAVLHMRVVSGAGMSFLDRMARLIDAAQGSKPKMQRLADRIAAWFVLVVVVIAAVTLLGWLAAGASVAHAVINAVSVLVIACPCALGLATPAAILAGTGAGARRGILIRNADAIEAAAKVDYVVFDKTGTLTLGTPQLREVVTLGRMDRDEVLRIAAALAAADTHPLSAALRRPGVGPAGSVRALAGLGVEGIVAGSLYRLGAAKLVGGIGTDFPGGDAATWSYLACAEGDVLAAFAFIDTIRPEASAEIARLRAMGLQVMMLSGDHEGAARAVADEIGVTNVIAGANPEAKLDVIKKLRAQGHVVAMVGDGINDAACLAAADVGMAMGEAADVTIEAADISLLRPDLRLVGEALALSLKTWSVLRGGLFWALIYNLIGIPAAAFGWLSPAIAGGAMAASSVCVLGNALRLGRWRP
ncbi:MAG: cation-translocating P-type ATPase [Acidocella sp.]|nr:cation-translocating P-type ATPase [Acidocella sp.]